MVKWAIHPVFLLLTSTAFAQDMDLTSIRNLEEKLPSYNRTGVIKPDDIRPVIGDVKKYPPLKITTLKRIRNSGMSFGYLRAGSQLVRLDTNETFKIVRPIFVRCFMLEDEYGLKYIVNNDGTVIYRADSRFVEPIKEELALYEPPLKYTPAPINKLKKVYDSKLALSPEGAVYVGIVNGDYMRDLFNDSKARTGVSTQYGLHYFTAWDLPVKAGAVLHYEKTDYNLSEGGSVNYTALSFGPQLKTKNLEMANIPYRLQLQVRVSPFAKASAAMTNAKVDFKFNSTDLLASFEHPMKNRWGEWVFGAFYQAQWLNFKDQPEIVSIKASNKINTTIGLSLAQVFE